MENRNIPLLHMPLKMELPKKTAIYKCKTLISLLETLITTFKSTGKMPIRKCRHIHIFDFLQL